MTSLICPECGVFVMLGWARCYNCGHELEDNLDDYDFLEGGERMDTLKQFEEGQKLSDRKIQQLSAQPIIETKISTSKDGKWVIVKTVITDIKPATYWKKVLQ